MANAGFQIILLAVLFAYCWFVWRYRRAAVDSLKSVVTMKTEEAPAGFLVWAMALAILGVGIATVKAVNAPGILETMGVTGALTGSGAAGRGSATEIFAAWGISSAGLVVIVAIAALCIVLLQIGVLKGAGKLVFAEEVTDNLIRTKKTYLAAAAVLVVPPILMLSGGNPIRDQILIYIIGTEVIATMLMFAGNTFLLFVKQKCSLLVWFLYLCAVEIFPVSLAVMLAARGV
jgi:hypothetical protein